MSVLSLHDKQVLKMCLSGLKTVTVYDMCTLKGCKYLRELFLVLYGRDENSTSNSRDFCFHAIRLR